MKIFGKISSRTILILGFVVIVTGLAKLTIAASTPSLGSASTYAILSSTYTNTSAGTTINGDIGFTTGPAVHPAGVQTNYGSAAPYSTAGTDQGSALTALAAQSPCTFTFAPGAIDLATDTTHGPIGVYTPGIYCTTGAASIGTAGITLSGSGTYIFRIVGALTSASGAVVTLSGASACDVFWTPTQATTLGVNNIFVGTDIDAAGVTIGANTVWTGRALAFGGTVTTDTDTISVPNCTSTGTINVVKTVINDSGTGTKVVADFPLFVNGSSVTSGITNTFTAPGTYTVTETNNPAAYAATFSGDCNSSGNLSLNSGIDLFCIITNNDIAAAVVPPAPIVPVPPIIDVVKVPSPLSLPGGPGSVTYTYTLTNIGTVPVTNITMVGDTCSPITLTSGDTNGNSILEVSETWVFHCTTTLSATHTNTVVATGVANGITATDIASATVIVGIPIVPPLIHVTKVPNPLTLPVGGGSVIYTKRVTNPGTASLSNVIVTDDKCNPVKFISGDTNGNSKLDPTETWIYTCQSNLTATTTNTATASGSANGLIARDFAIVTVVVASDSIVSGTVTPGLPNAGSVSGCKCIQRYTIR